MTRITQSNSDSRFYKETIASLNELAETLSGLEEQLSDMLDADEVDLYDLADLHSVVDNIALSLRVLASVVSDENLSDDAHVELMELITGYLCEVEDLYDIINEFMDDVLRESDAELAGISEAAEDSHLAVSIDIDMPAAITIDGDEIDEKTVGGAEVLEVETDLDSELTINGVPVVMDLPEEDDENLVRFFVPGTAVVTVNGAKMGLSEGQDPEDVCFELSLSVDESFTVNGVNVTLRGLTEYTDEDEDDEDDD